MLKTCIIITLTICLTFISLVAYGEVVNIIELDGKNILDSDEVEVTVNNTPVKVTLVEKDDTLYIEKGFLAGCFDNYERKIKDTTLIYGATLKNDKGEEIEFLPLFLAFKALNIRYSYNAIYGQNIVKISVGEEFTPLSPYIDVPISEEVGDNEDMSGKYPAVNYSTSTIEYYHSPGYKEGIYFGDYGNGKEGDNPQYYMNTNQSFGPMGVISF